MRRRLEPRIFTDATDFHRLSVLIRRIRVNQWFLFVAEMMITAGMRILACYPHRSYNGVAPIVPLGHRVKSDHTRSAQFHAREQAGAFAHNHFTGATLCKGLNVLWFDFKISPLTLKSKKYLEVCDEL